MEAAKNIMPDDIREICKRCAHRSSCKVLCYPVLLYLNRLNPVMEYKAFEKDFLSIFPERHHVQAGLISIESSKFLNKAFRNGAESAFLGAEHDTNLITTRIFVDRFFKQDSFENIAMRYDLTQEETETRFYRAWDSIAKILQYFSTPGRETRSRAQENIKEKALAVILKLKAEGKSNREIADYLTVNKFPTHYKAGRSGSWSKATVQRYLSEVKNG